MLKMFRNTIYIRIRAEKIHLLQIESGSELNMPPVLAIETLANGQKQLVAFGDNAKEAVKLKSGIELVNGFKHQRSLIADFTIAEQTLKICFRMLCPKSIFAPSPIVIFHPLEMNEGGYTQVELRAFEELCRQAGARKVFIKVGAELSKDELLKISNVGNYEQ